MGAEYTAAQKAATEKYLADKTDRLSIRLPKGRKATLGARAAERGQSITEYLIGFVLADLGLTEDEWKHGQP